MHKVYIYISLSLLACKPMASCNISCGGGAKKNRTLEGPVAHLGPSAQPAQSHLVHPDLRKSWATAGWSSVSEAGDLKQSIQPYLFKGCRPCRRPRKNRQGSQANWHKNSSVLRTLRLSTFFLCILLWNIFDRFEFSFVNGFFMIYWLSWSRRSLCMSIQVRAMWSGGVAVWVAVFDLGWTYNKWHYHKGIFTLWSWTKLHCVARGCLARNYWFVLMVFSFHFFLGWCVWPPLRES